MDIFGSLFGKPEDLIKKVITGVTPTLAKPILTEYFNDHMNAAARQKLGDHLIAAGQALHDGKVSDASGDLAQVLGEIKF